LQTKETGYVTHQTLVVLTVSESTVGLYIWFMGYEASCFFIEVENN
jgi:hypothetical protein